MKPPPPKPANLCAVMKKAAPKATHAKAVKRGAGIGLKSVSELYRFYL